VTNATGWWFSPGILVSSTNKTDRHDIIEILLKVALNTKDYQFGICCFSTKHTACERAKPEWHGIKIRCWSGATCLSMDCFFSELEKTTDLSQITYKFYHIML
jgi:hypothetical protein